LLLGMGASAIPFFLQAANEVLVVSSTDWGPREPHAQIEHFGSPSRETLPETRRDIA